MSAQERKEAGTTAPIIPREPQGCLPRFLRRLFVPQSTPKIGDFATKLDKEVNDYYVAKNKQDIGKREAEAAKQATQDAEQVRLMLRRQRQEEQARLKSTVALNEAMEVLDGLQIGPKLMHIRKTVWKGRGRIAPLQPNFGITYGTRKGSDLLGGLELVHEYPFFFRAAWEESSLGDEHSPTLWRYEPRVISRGLRVSVFRRQNTGEKIINIYSEAETQDNKYGKMLPYIHSSDPNPDLPFETKTERVIDVDIPLNGSNEERTLVDSALAQETINRIARNLLPAQLEQATKGVLDIAKKSSAWRKPQMGSSGMR